MDLSHLDALRARLQRERERYQSATTERERTYRAVLIAQCEREISGEYKHLGIPELSADDSNVSVDDLAAELE